MKEIRIVKEEIENIKSYKSPKIKIEKGEIS